MSKFSNLKVGDTIVITGINENLFECNDDNYDTLLGVMNQPCEVVEIYNLVNLYVLSENNPEDYCQEITKKGVLIKSPKLQGHTDGGNNKCLEGNCFWIGEDYVNFESTISLDDTMNIFDKLNESDDFEWAEEIIKDTPDVVDYRTVKQGDKVVPGKDWMFGNQAQNSVYGIVDMEEYGGEPMFIEDSTDEEFWQYWVHVDWIGKGGSVMFRNNYRVGPDYHDLKYYVPKPTKRKKGIKESEENIQEITHNDLQVGMTVIVDGYDVVEETQKWENEIGTVVYNYNEDELETGNSFTISFKNWAKGHDGSSNLAAECGHNKCWSFYDDCAHWNLPRYDGACQNIDGIKFYTVNTYDLFDQLNESEEDDFGWAKETISQEYHRYGDILPYLENDDIISVTGDFTSDEGEVLLSVEDEPFKVFSYTNKAVYLKWVKSEEERPKHWKAITDGYENVHMGDNTFDWDKELMVKVVSRENYPF